jgi:hypothetical protein
MGENPDDLMRKDGVNRRRKSKSASQHWRWMKETGAMPHLMKLGCADRDDLLRK